MEEVIEMGFHYKDIEDDFVRDDQKEYEPQISEEKESTALSSTKVKIVDADLVNVRSQPTLQSTVVKTLKRGDIVDMDKKLSSFYRVVYDDSGHIGYISSVFCEEV